MTCEGGDDGYNNAREWDFVGEILSVEEEAAQECDTRKRESAIRYNSRKPTWWLRLSRKPTKAQKRVLRELAHYRIMKPRYGTLLDWSTVFPQRKDSPIWFEIGCGNGDNLLALTHLHPNHCHVGAEVHAAGAGALLQRIQQGLNGVPWDEYKLLGTGRADFHQKSSLRDHSVGRDCECEGESSAYAPNLRVFVGDGIGLLDRIPNNSLDAILITFPDPFAREGEENLRVFQTHTVHSMQQRLRPRGRLYLATDHPVMFEWAHRIISETNCISTGSILSLVEPCPNRQSWLPVVSKYEQKGLDEGRSTMLSCWENTKT